MATVNFMPEGKNIVKLCPTQRGTAIGVAVALMPATFVVRTVARLQCSALAM